MLTICECGDVCVFFVLLFLQLFCLKLQVKIVKKNEGSKNKANTRCVISFCRKLCNLLKDTKEDLNK